jgi:acetyl-CoA carboxylase carboxyl transferase subunit beta
MQLNNLFKRSKPEEPETQPAAEAPRAAETTKACPRCQAELTESQLEACNYVCSCGYHFRMAARKRLNALIDADSFWEMDSDMKGGDPIQFTNYESKKEKLRASSGENEGVICGVATIGGQKCAIFVMEPYFMMGSMGCVVGEKVTRLFEFATQNRLPVVGYTVSGGARMQEGILSLMQMAKTSGAVKMHSDAGLLYIVVLTDPTTGGVTASYAMEADIILSEPGALIGFAGPRVIEQTIRKKLPAGFQRAEFQVEHGFVDAIVPRPEQQQMLSQLLKLHAWKDIRHTITWEPADAVTIEGEVEPKPLTAYARVQASRSSSRPTGSDYIRSIFHDFVELHGDRRFADDAAIVGGVAWLRDLPVTVIAIEKGKDLSERFRRNFGSPMPEGYRKALRLMKQAEKFHRPVVCFVDTAGAGCDMGAEERGQGQAIAENLMEMMWLKTPIVTVMVGQGGSGGALALAVANEVWMEENAWYSVISPEGCASILWKDSKKVEEACECLHLTAADLKGLGVIDWVLPEDDPKDFSPIFQSIEVQLAHKLPQLMVLSPEDIAQQRYSKFRKFGTLNGAIQ